MTQQTISDLNRKLEQLRQRKVQLMAREHTAERRLRTRQAVILGSWMMSHRPAWVEDAKTQLERPQDRAAFGLPAMTVDIALDDLQDVKT